MAEGAGGVIGAAWFATAVVGGLVSILVLGSGFGALLAFSFDRLGPLWTLLWVLTLTWITLFLVSMHAAP